MKNKNFQKVMDNQGKGILRRSMPMCTFLLGWSAASILALTSSSSPFSGDSVEIQELRIVNGQGKVVARLAGSEFGAQLRIWTRVGGKIPKDPSIEIGHDAFVDPVVAVRDPHSKAKAQFIVSGDPPTAKTQVFAADGSLRGSISAPISSEVTVLRILEPDGARRFVQ